MRASYKMEKKPKSKRHVVVTRNLRNRGKRNEFGNEDNEAIDVEGESGNERDTKSKEQILEEDSKSDGGSLDDSVNESGSSELINTETTSSTPERQESKPNEKQMSNSKSQLQTIICYGAYLVAIVLAVIFAAYVAPEEINPLFISTDTVEDDYNYVKVFDDGLKKLKMEFTNQTARFWKVLKTRALRHLKEKQPRQPLVILIGAPPPAHTVVDYLASRLAMILDPQVEKIENLKTINGADLRNIKDGNAAKKVLDESLDDIFHSKGRRVAVVKHLELLPPPSENLFYAYCDNDNARFKHVAILFTVYLPREPSPSLTAVEAEGKVDTYLADEIWNDERYSQDAVAALLTRIAETVVLANGEQYFD